MKEKYSTTFLLMAVAFIVCLVTSNLFATKVFALGWGINLPGAVIIFPISYILNDCIAEVWGYRRARLVIWLAFLSNFFVVLMGQVVVWLPAASFWDGGDHFNYMFNMAPRVFVASMLAFLAGSTMNALVLSKMKVASEGRRFGVRAIVSSVAGELLDSLIFMPIAFWGTPVKVLLGMMVAQVSFKVLYEIVILPVTAWVVRRVKAHEEVDVYDRDINYNPFKIKDIQ
ncbi:MAG: queuosine precursor transporter [Bacteroidales bacterium]|nr:queuosine precursor transporter [Bacteroidales bacterium]